MMCHPFQAENPAKQDSLFYVNLPSHDFFANRALPSLVPLPVPDFLQILTIFSDVLLVLNQLVIHLLDQE